MTPNALCRSSATPVSSNAAPWLELKHIAFTDEPANPEAQLRRFAAALTLDPAPSEFADRPAPVAFGDDDEEDYDDLEDDDDEDDDFDDDFDDEDDFDDDEDDFEDEDEDEDEDFDDEDEEDLDDEE